MERGLKDHAMPLLKCEYTFCFFCLYIISITVYLFVQEHYLPLIISLDNPEIIEEIIQHTCIMYLSNYYFQPCNILWFLGIK